MMKAPHIEIKNPDPVLSGLLRIIPDSRHENYLYVGFPGGTFAANLISPVPGQNALGLKEQFLPEILQALGIRSLTLNALHDLAPLVELGDRQIKGSNGESAVFYLQNMQVVKELQRLFRKCRTIAFDDWAMMINASELWRELLSAVVAPLEKQDLEFIFYLGNAGGKLSLQVDEALKTISDFSVHGKVTLALDENEAISLWKMLNGVQASTVLEHQTAGDLKKKYFSIFNTIGITRLLIYSSNDAILLSSDDQFVFSRKTVSSATEIADSARHNFVEGFSIGLLLELDLIYCIALGLIVFGSYGENEALRDQKTLLSYIEKWIIDLNRPDSIFLYQ